MVYDSKLIDHMIELKNKKNEKVPSFYKIAKFVLSNKICCIFVELLEKLLKFLFSLPIPIYKDIVLFVITYLPGSPYILGNYLRSVYWSSRLKKMGKNSIIEQGVIIRYPENMEVDEFVLIDKNVLLEVKKVKIGKRIHIAENCVISGGGEFIMEDYSCIAHSSAVVTATDTPKDGIRASGPMIPWEQRKVIIGKVVIKKDAFVGMGARILPNVIIGEGAVIASGALVNKNIPPWKIVAGIPARIISEREKVKFSDI